MKKSTKLIATMLLISMLVVGLAVNASAFYWYETNYTSAGNQRGYAEMWDSAASASMFAETGQVQQPTSHEVAVRMRKDGDNFSTRVYVTGPYTNMSIPLSTAYNLIAASYESRKISNNSDGWASATSALKDKDF